MWPTSEFRSQAPCVIGKQTSAPMFLSQRASIGGLLSLSEAPSGARPVGMSRVGSVPAWALGAGERWALITQSTMVRALPRVVWQKDQVVDSRHRGPRATARVPYASAAKACPPHGLCRKYRCASTGQPSGCSCYSESATLGESVSLPSLAKAQRPGLGVGGAHSANRGRLRSA